MSENRFTPGPWKYEAVIDSKSNRIQWIQVSSKKESWIAEAKGHHVGPQSDEEIEANAKLIASAPELLQALSEAREMLIASGMKEDSVGLIGINNVIKKATE